MSPGDTQPRLGPGRRADDVERVVRQVTWRNYQHLRLLIIGALALAIIVPVVEIAIFKHQIQTSRTSTARVLCAAIDGVRVRSRTGFATVVTVAGRAGLHGRDLQDLRQVVIGLDHPPASQNCRLVVNNVEQAQPQHPARQGANP
jgi:hypothetical protein